MTILPVLPMPEPTSYSSPMPKRSIPAVSPRGSNRRRSPSRWRANFVRGIIEVWATVVLKLFHLVPASVAYFGLKDYQQWLVIRRMVEDLNVPIRIEACATVREADGLAMSSRNRYLSSDQRQQATCLSRALRQTAEMVDQGEIDVATLEAALRRTLEDAGVSQIDYARIVDADSLDTIQSLTGRSVALIAARVGNTRLIDNRVLER